MKCPDCGGKDLYMCIETIARPARNGKPEAGTAHEEDWKYFCDFCGYEWKAGDVPEFLQSRGWTEESTGQGCTALRRELRNGGYALLTMDGDGRMPPYMWEHPFKFGVYRADGMPISFHVKLFTEGGK